ncbi:MAG: 50S ribosomal protein L18 [Candidatus Omnitrophica bacterium]|nr:50S ribosomal protein L18 [Candidatus Omnitrophota bacterium]MCK5180604.1 50S ribosomal protein L18 [Candidatus Omnitrophota bacterium]
MSITKDKEQKRIGRHRRIRKKIAGTVDQPRLCVHRSLTNFYAQIVDDSAGKVLFGMSTRNKGVSSKAKGGGNIAAASVLGEAFAAEAQKKGIKKVCFDRGGYLYHGRIKAFAEGARKGGMEF